jgi:hypothetical protein
MKVKLITVILLVWGLLWWLGLGAKKKKKKETGRA